MSENHGPQQLVPKERKISSADAEKPELTHGVEISLLPDGSLTVDIDPDAWAADTEIAHTLSTWLACSNEPLSITVSFPVDSVSHTKFITSHAIIRSIVAHAVRWKVLNLFAIPDVLLAPLCSLSTPLLEELYVTSLRVSSHVAPGVFDGRSFYKKSPKLSYLFLDGLLGQNAASFQSKSLTDLTLSWERSERIPISHFVRILGNMPRLTKFHASLPVLEVDTIINSRIPLRSLYKIKLESAGGRDENEITLGWLFHCLHVPSLTSLQLDISLVLSDLDAAAAAFLSMVRRCRCFIKKLAWPRLDCLDDALLKNIFSELPSLKYLKTDGCNLTKDIIDALTCNPMRHAASLLPNLTHLRLMFEDPRMAIGLTDIQLALMIHSRCKSGVDGPNTGNGVSRLKSVEVRGERIPQFYSPALWCLAACRLTGVDLRLILTDRVSYETLLQVLESDMVQALEPIIEGVDEVDDSSSDEDEPPSSPCTAGISEGSDAVDLTPSHDLDSVDYSVAGSEY